MDLNQAKSQLLDTIFDAYVAELRQAGDENAAITLGYTRSLNRFWRQVLRMLPVQPFSDVLDAGSGLGLLPFELAANMPLQAHGTDINESFIAHSRVLQARIAEAGLFVDDAGVDFAVAEVCAQPYADRSFDLIFVRELLQFVPDPVAALRELYRVLRPGGFVCVSDMDDGLRITWPPASAPLERLVGAVAGLQEEQGGDRHVGRKLTTHLRAAGFGINSIAVIPEAQHRLVDTGDNERSLIIEQLHAARTRLEAAGALDAAGYDADLATIEREEPFEEFRMNAKLVVMAQRPAL